jgi:hypothetical protein
VKRNNEFNLLFTVVGIDHHASSSLNDECATSTKSAPLNRFRAGKGTYNTSNQTKIFASLIALIP